MKTKKTPIILIATILISVFLFAGCKPQICPYTQKEIDPGRRDEYFSELKKWQKSGSLPYDNGVLKTIAEIVSSLQYENEDMSWSIQHNEDGSHYVFFGNDNMGCCIYVNAIGDIWEVEAFDLSISEYEVVYKSEDYESPKEQNEQLLTSVTPTDLNPIDPRMVAGEINPQKIEEYLTYLKEQEEFDFTDEAFTIIAEIMSSFPIEELDHIDVKPHYVNADAKWAIIMYDSNGTRYQISIDDEGTVLFIYGVYDEKDVRCLYSRYI